MGHIRTFATPLAAALLSLAVCADRAAACGGLFCSGGVGGQVNQTAERIVFAHNPGGSITALIQILYEGPSDEFAWIVPVAGVPEVGVSSTVVLDALQQATNPTYNLQIQRDFCGSSSSGFDDWGGGGGCLCGGCAQASPSSGPQYSNVGGDLRELFPVVTVQAQASVGPYDYTVLSVTPFSLDPAQVAMDWLTDNGYDVGLAGDVLRPYLLSGLNLLAVKLTKGSPVGSIRPLRMIYRAAMPSIPITPTAVAANDDMGVMVWIFGGVRAVPFNYKTFELNEVLVDWLSPGNNYNDLVGQAADETGGQGFLTEYAGTSLWGEPTEVSGQIDALSDAETPVQALLDADQICSGIQPGDGGRCRTWDGFDDAIAAASSLPAGAVGADVMRCADLATSGQQPPAAEELDCDALSPEAIGLDLTAFEARLAELVIDPVIESWRLLSPYPYVTRLYTTMSPEEMTVDPGFVFNPQLPQVDNQHRGNLEVACDGSWHMQLQQDGGLLNTSIIGASVNNPWPVSPDSASAALRIYQHGTAGQGELLEDNSHEVADLTFGTLDCHADFSNPAGSDGSAGFGSGSDGSPSDGPGLGRSGGSSGPEGDSGPMSSMGCGVTGNAVGNAWLPLLSLLALLRRRRRQR